MVHVYKDVPVYVCMRKYIGTYISVNAYAYIWNVSLCFK